MLGRVRTGLEKCLNFSGILTKCLVFNFALKMVIFFLEKCLKMTILSLQNEASIFFLCLVTFSYYKSISFQWKKNTKKSKKQKNKPIFIYPFWMICDLMVNYVEIQGFVKLPCFCFLQYIWNNTENVPENCKNVLEKNPWKVLVFFFSGNLYLPWLGQSVSSKIMNDNKIL